MVTPLMKRATYRLALTYDGAQFAGFARQPGRITVESAVREGISALGVELKAFAVAGRTDRGVSAQDQVLSFRLAPPIATERVQQSINAQVPTGLLCTEVRVVPRSFHATFSAKARRYAYLWPNPDGLSPAKVQPMLTELIGRRCFSAFARDTKAGQSTVRTLKEARVEAGHVGCDPVLVFHFMGDAFLRKMVRVLVATTIREALANAPAGRLVELAAQQDRRQTAWPAAPEPLRLTRVIY